MTGFLMSIAKSAQAEVEAVAGVDIDIMEVIEALHIDRSAGHVRDSARNDPHVPDRPGHRAGVCAGGHQSDPDSRGDAAGRSEAI